MVLSNDEKMEAIGDVAKAAKLCRMHGLLGWDKELTHDLVPRIRQWNGPTCEDVQPSLKRRKRRKRRKRAVEVETFETMLCNQLCTYIHLMPLDRSRMAERIQPFEYMNHLVLQHLRPIELAVAKLLFSGTYMSKKLFLAAGVPPEYLHTQLRAYDVKARLLGYILGVSDDDDVNAKASECGKNLKKHDEYEELIERGETLLKQYQMYPEEDRERVATHYGRTCLNAEYPPSPSPIQQ